MYINLNVTLFCSYVYLSEYTNNMLHILYTSCLALSVRPHKMWQRIDLPLVASSHWLKISSFLHGTVGAPASSETCKNKSVSPSTLIDLLSSAWQLFNYSLRGPSDMIHLLLLHMQLLFKSDLHCWHDFQGDTTRVTQIKSAVLFLKIGHSNLQIIGNASIHFVYGRHARKTRANLYLVHARQEGEQKRIGQNLFSSFAWINKLMNAMHLF